jgi:heat shock protein beta
MTDVLDEYVMGQLTEYDDRKLANVSKDDVRLDDDDDKDGKDKDKKDGKKKDADKEAVAPLLKWWKEKLTGKVSAVRASSRLASTPCVVVASKFGQTANMERIMRAQALGGGGGGAGTASYMRGQRVLEVNPRHPLVRQLLAKVEADPDDAKAASAAALLFDTALLESGYLLEDAKDFAGRVYGVLAAELGGTSGGGEGSEGGSAAAAGGGKGKEAATAKGEEKASSGGSKGKEEDEEQDGDDDKDEL